MPLRKIKKSVTRSSDTAATRIQANRNAKTKLTIQDRLFVGYEPPSSHAALFYLMGINVIYLMNVVEFILDIVCLLDSSI